MKFEHDGPPGSYQTNPPDESNVNKVINQTNGANWQCKAVKMKWNLSKNLSFVEQVPAAFRCQWNI